MSVSAAARSPVPAARSVSAGDLDTFPSSSEADRWDTIAKGLAVLGVVLIAARVDLRYLFTLGDLLGLLMLPVWLPVLRRYLGARLLLSIGAIALGMGLVLTLVRSADHRVSPGAFLTETALILSLLVSFGFLLWAREHLSLGALGALFGLGLFFGLPLTNPLFPGNPWKYGVGFAVSVLALGLARSFGRRSLELVIVVLLMAVAALTDFRSAFAILTLVAALLVWQARPSGSRRASVGVTLVSVVVAGVAVYQLAQGLILAGYFGAETQARTQQQLDTAGSLLLGGRPELAATLALMRHDILGFGPGVRPTFEEIAVAKTAMSAINYDPENGYVEHWMFGRGVALHSITGDLWARCGLAGLAFVLVLLVLVARRFAHLLATRSASGLELLLGVYVLWSLLFEPYYSGLARLILLLALMVPRRPSAPATPGQELTSGRSPAMDSRDRYPRPGAPVAQDG